MDATLTIQVKVIGQQAAAQLAAIQKEVSGVAAAGAGAAAGASVGGGAFSGIAGVAGTAMSVMNKFGSAIDNMEQKLGGMAQHIGMAGRQLTFGFTLPIVGAGTAMTKWALDNERAMTQVQKVYGDLSFSAERVKTETDALATTFTLLSNAYGVNSTEVINMGAQWAAVGLTGTSLAQATKATMEAMVLGGLSAEDATNSILTLASAYKLSFKDMGGGFSEVTDAMAIMNAIENQTGASFGDLAEGMKRAASVGHDYGLSIQELGGLIAALVPATGTGAAAGNAIKSILTHIMVPLGPAKDILEQIGIDLSGKEWNTANAVGKIQIMSKAFQGLDANTRNTVSALVAGSWQVNRFGQIMSDIQDPHASFAKAMEASGDATSRQKTYLKELNAVLDSNPKKFEILSNMIKNELTGVMISLLPTFIKFVAYLEQVVNAFNNLTPETRKWILMIIGGIAALGPMLMMIAALIRVLQGVFLGMKAVSAIIGGVFKVIGFFIKGIGFMVRALMTAATWVSNLGITLGNFLVAQAERAYVALSNLAAEIYVAAEAMIKNLIAATVAGAKALGEFLIRVALNAIVLGSVFVKSLLDSAAAMTAQLIPGIRLAVEALGRLIVEVILLAYRFAFATAYIAGDFLTGLALVATSIWQWMVPAFEGMIVSIQSTVVWLGPVLLQAFYTFTDAIALAVVEIGRFVVALTTEAIGALVGFAAQMWKNVTAAAYFLVAIAEEVIELGINFVAAVGQAAAALIVQLIPATAGATEAFYGLLVVVTGVIAEVVASLVGVVVPAVMGIMSVIAAAVVGIAAAVGLPVWAVVAIIIAALAVIALVVAAVFNEDVHDTIVEALWSVYDNMVRFGQFVVDIFIWIYDQLVNVIQHIIDMFSYLNPFARHSPSLVDNVKAGVGVILDEYKKLAHIPNLVRAAAAAQKAFMDATKGARDTEENRKISVDRQVVVSQAPQATGAFDSMIQARKVLEQSLVPLTAEIDKQTQVVAKLQERWDALDSDLKKHKQTLDDLEAQYKKVGDAIDDAKNKIQDLLDTPLTGQTAMEDEIYANQLAVKRLQLQLMQMEDVAAGGVGNVTDAFKDLGSAIDDLQSSRDALYQSGAGSDILSVYDEQIAALRAQQKAIGQSVDGVDALKAKIEELQRAGDELDLQKALTFDDQEHQLERMSTTIKEMSFGDIATQIAQQKGVIETLTPIYADLGAKVEAEKATVEAITAERDKLGAILDVEKQKLDDLNQAFTDIKGLIDSMNSDMRDFVQGLKDAKQAAEDLKKAQEGGITPGDYPTIEGTGLTDIPGIGDLPDLNKQLEDMNKNLKNIGKIPNPFSAIIDWIKDIPSHIVDVYNWLNDLGWSIIDGIWSGMQSAASWIWDHISDWIHDNIISPFLNVLGIHSPSTVMADEVGKPVVEGLWEGIKSMASWIWERLQEVPGWIIGALATAGSWLIGTGWAVLQGLWDGIFSLKDWLADNMPKAKDWILEKLGDAGKWLIGTGWSILTGLWNGIQSLSSWLTDKAKLIFWWIIGAFATAGTWLYETGKTILTGLWNGLNSLYSWFIGIMATIKNWVTTAVIGAGGWLYQTGIDIIKGLWNGITSPNIVGPGPFSLNLKNWFQTNVVDQVVGLFENGSPSKLFMRIGNDVIEGFAIGIESETDRVVKVMGDLSQAVVDAVNIDIPPIQANVEIGANITGLPTPDDLNALQTSVFDMTGKLVGSSATEAVQAVTNQYNSTSSMWMATKDKQVGYPGYTAPDQQAPIIVNTPDASKTVTLTGDLVFPNITSPDDAQLLIDNLKSMVDD